MILKYPLQSRGYVPLSADPDQGLTVINTANTSRSQHRDGIIATEMLPEARVCSGRRIHRLWSAWSHDISPACGTWHEHRTIPQVPETPRAIFSDDKKKRRTIPVGTRPQALDSRPILRIPTDDEKKQSSPEEKRKKARPWP